nr:unnamed protein product [Digitaria exilis]
MGWQVRGLNVVDGDVEAGLIHSEGGQVPLDGSHLGHQLRHHLLQLEQVGVAGVAHGGGAASKGGVEH